MRYPDDLDEEHIDELRWLAEEKPTTMVEIFRTDFIALLDMAQELLEIKRKKEEQ